MIFVSGLVEFGLNVGINLQRCRRTRVGSARRIIRCVFVMYRAIFDCLPGRESYVDCGENSEKLMKW